MGGSRQKSEASQLSLGSQETGTAEADQHRAFRGRRTFRRPLRSLDCVHASDGIHWSACGKKVSIAGCRYEANHARCLHVHRAGAAAIARSLPKGESQSGICIRLNPQKPCAMHAKLTRTPLQATADDRTSMIKQTLRQEENVIDETLCQGGRMRERNLEMNQYIGVLKINAAGRNPRIP